MLSPKLFTGFLQDISASFEQDQGIPVDTLLMVYLLFADDLVLFSESAEGLQKQLTVMSVTQKYAETSTMSRPVVGKLSPTIAFKAFDCQILPILEYGSYIWYTGDDVNDVEKNTSKID